MTISQIYTLPNDKDYCDCVVIFSTRKTKFFVKHDFSIFEPKVTVGYFLFLVLSLSTKLHCWHISRNFVYMTARQRWRHICRCKQEERWGGVVGYGTF